MNTFVASNNPTATQTALTTARNAVSATGLGALLQPLGLYLSPNAPPPPAVRSPNPCTCFALSSIALSSSSAEQRLRWHLSPGTPLLHAVSCTLRAVLNGECAPLIPPRTCFALAS